MRPPFLLPSSPPPPSLAPHSSLCPSDTQPFRRLACARLFRRATGWPPAATYASPPLGLFTTLLLHLTRRHANKQHSTAGYAIWIKSAADHWVPFLRNALLLTRPTSLQCSSPAGQYLDPFSCGIHVPGKNADKQRPHLRYTCEQDGLCNTRSKRQGEQELCQPLAVRSHRRTFRFSDRETLADEALPRSPDLQSAHVIRAVANGQSPEPASSRRPIGAAHQPRIAVKFKRVFTSHAGCHVVALTCELQVLPLLAPS